MTEEIRRIVVGVDCVGGADPVLRPAIELADRLRAELVVVHGYMLVDPLLDAYARSGYLSESALVDHGRAMQATLERQIHEATASQDVTVRVIAGPAFAAITEAASELGADLIVVGPSRHGSFPLSLLGTTHRAVLRRAAVPVLIMKQDGVVIPRKILVATDLTAVSSVAYAEGVEMALAAGVDPTVRTLLVVGKSLLTLPVDEHLLRGVAEQELTGFTDRVAVGPEVIERTVREGEPASEILAEAKEWGADLIVLGTHGRKGLERVLLGSVAEKTIRGAACNVLIVPWVTSTDSADEELAGAMDATETEPRPPHRR